jgi:hypothetical protein
MELKTAVDSDLESRMQVHQDRMEANMNDRRDGSKACLERKEGEDLEETQEEVPREETAVETVGTLEVL